MRQAEGTFNLDRFDDEAPYGNREGVKLARAHIGKTFIIPDEPNPARSITSSEAGPPGSARRDGHRMTESTPDTLLAAVTAEAGLKGTQIVRGTGKSMLVAGEMDGEPVIAKILLTADPFWVAKWRHEIDIYRSFARERPPVRIPELKWMNGQTALILEWIGDRPADEGRYLSRPLDAGDIAGVVGRRRRSAAGNRPCPGRRPGA